MRNPARYPIAVVTLAALAAGTETYAQTLELPDANTIDLAFRLLFTVLVAVIVPVYLVKYGPANFLWFSDIGLLGIFAALCSRVRCSAARWRSRCCRMLWIVSFVTGAFARGRGATTLASYMFDTSIPLYLRLLSCSFHFSLPPGALWLVYRYGYDERALAAQTMLAWVVLPATLWLAPAEKNVNWVRGFGHPPSRRVPLGVHFALVMLMFPLAVYVPTHFLLRWLD